jgi:hypothetical protein
MMISVEWDLNIFRRIKKAIDDINNPAFVEAKTMKRFAAPVSRRAITAVARDEYTKKTLYKTGRSRNSFTTVPMKVDGPGVVTYSKIEGSDGAPAVSGDSEDRFSYAAFFEKPLSFDSFILKTAPDKAHKPFFKALTIACQVEARVQARSAFIGAIVDRIGKIQVGAEIV